jgi:predicted Zn finger-like uncharacterized protein
MILTCPACATRYFVNEAKLGPQGRKVRCASCGASWQAGPDGLAAKGVAEPLAEPLEPVRPADALPQSFRAQAQARKQARRAVAAGAVWAGLVAGFAVLMLCAVVFRVQVVRLLPRAAGAYAALRLPVNPLGLTPEQVQASPGLQDGHPMLFVSGVERNIEAAPRAPADLRVSLYDRAGARVASLVAPVAGDALSPGEGRSFRTAFVDPPLSGVQVGVDFVFAAPSSAARKATIAAAPSLRGPTAAPPPAMRLQPVTVAQPLPASSPYALPSAARPQAAMPSS